MKVTLIAPPIMDFGPNGRLKSIAMDEVRECPPYGMYMLTETLRAAGHDALLIDLIAEGTASVRRHENALAESSLIGFGATSMSWPTALKVIRRVREINPVAPIVMGGIHPTMFDRYVLSRYPIDYVVRGEGELAITALCEAMEGRRTIDTVPNLSWKHGHEIVRNPIGQKLTKEELPTFPVADYSQLPMGVYNGLAIESSRGCAFDCSFCSTSYRRSWRGIGAEEFVDRLEMVLPHVNRTKFGTVHIIDDEFSMNPARATDIANSIHRRGLKPLLVYDSRAKDLMWEGYMESMAPLTCQFLIGAECGYDEGLKKIGKGSTCELLEKAAFKLYRLGVSERADFSFVLGLPWETRAEVEKTIRFAIHLFGKYGVRVLLQWYCEIPGSRLWDDDQKAGLVTEAMYDDFGFFRNLYLFRVGVRGVSAREIYEISDMVAHLKSLARLQYPNRKMIEYSFPMPVSQYFPADLLDEVDTGLASLREVARGPAKQPLTPSPSTPLASLSNHEAGIPLRHFVEAAQEAVARQT